MLTKEHFQLLSCPLSAMLDPGDLPVAMAVCWALAWIGSGRLAIFPSEAALLLSLYRLWQEAIPRREELAYFASWAFSTQRLLPRDTFSDDDWGDCDTWLRQAEPSRTPTYSVGLVVAWYRRAPWNDTELAEKLSQVDSSSSFGTTTARDMLETLGEPGRRVLEEWDQGKR